VQLSVLNRCRAYSTIRSDHREQAFSLSVESTRLPIRSDHRERAFSFSVERLDPLSRIHVQTPTRRNSHVYKRRICGRSNDHCWVREIYNRVHTNQGSPLPTSPRDAPTASYIHHLSNFCIYRVSGKSRRIFRDLIWDPKRRKKSYKHRSGNKSFPSYSHFYVKKNVFYIPRGIPF